MTIRQAHDQQIDANVADLETSEFDIENCTKISLFVKPLSDFPSTHVVEIMVSPDGEEWESTGYTVEGEGSIHRDMQGRKAKARIKTPVSGGDGVPKLHISLIASRG